MRSENYETTRIENALRDSLVAINADEKVFFNRPKSKQADLEHFIVCNVSGAVDNLSSAGRCSFQISLFAKDLSNMKNSSRLSVMERAVLSGLPDTIGDCLVDQDEVRVLGDVPDGNGYHVRVLQVNNVIIKSV